MRDRRAIEFFRAGDESEGALDADACEAHHRFACPRDGVGADNERRLRRQQRSAPRSELAAETDIDRTGDMFFAERNRIAHIEDDRAAVDFFTHAVGRQRRCSDLGQRPRTAAVDLRIA